MAAPRRRARENLHGSPSPTPSHPGAGWSVRDQRLGAPSGSKLSRVIAFAIAYNTVAIALCLTGHMSPLLAAILMPASSLASLAIVVSSLRGSGK